MVRIEKKSKKRYRKDMRNVLLDLLFPKRCVNCKRIGDFLCGNCFARISFQVALICPLCNRASITGATHPSCKKRYGIDGLLPCVMYAGPVKRLTYQFKYPPYISKLQQFIAELMQESLENNEIFYNILKTNPLFIPVPLSSKRMKERGYNHSALLTRHVAQYFKREYSENVLARKRDTAPQFSLNRTARFANVSKAFVISSSEEQQRIKGRCVVVVDDIATTCSTLRECAMVLKKSGASKVWGLVLARENKY